LLDLLRPEQRGGPFRFRSLKKDTAPSVPEVFVGTVSLLSKILKNKTGDLREKDGRKIFPPEKESEALHKGNHDSGLFPRPVKKGDTLAWGNEKENFLSECFSLCTRCWLGGQTGKRGKAPLAEGGSSPGEATYRSKGRDIACPKYIAGGKEGFYYVSIESKEARSTTEKKDSFPEKESEPKGRGSTPLYKGKKNVPLAPKSGKKKPKQQPLLMGKEGLSQKSSGGRRIFHIDVYLSLRRKGVSRCRNAFLKGYLYFTCGKGRTRLGT